MSKLAKRGRTLRRKPQFRPLPDVARIRRFVESTGTVPIADVKRLLDVLDSPEQIERMADYLRNRPAPWGYL